MCIAILILGWEYFAFLKGYIWNNYIWKIWLLIPVSAGLEMKVKGVIIMYNKNMLTVY